jgi:DNA replication and repair protein RecF
VRITRLELTSFRNIASASIEPGPGVNLVVGANGQGKTNLVEAVSFLSWLKSFRTPRTADLVRHGDEAASVAATIDGRAGRREVRIGVGHGVRRGSVDGKAVRSARDTLDCLTVACLSPDDPAVLEGGPEGRRALLDRLVVLMDPSAAPVLARYGRLVRERNQALRMPPGTWEGPALDACEEAIAATGAEVVRRRLAALDDLVARLPAAMERMSGTDLGVRVRYASRWLRHGPGSAAVALRERLAATRPGDATLGYTTAGPHADDVEVEMQGLKARGHASRGQKKVLMLAWKAAEAEAFAAARGEDPVLVLDDALADLDPERQERVVGYLRWYRGQSFVTGASMPDTVLRCGTVFRAVGGAIEDLDV